jgi:hypothetical protein
MHFGQKRKCYIGNFMAAPHRVSKLIPEVLCLQGIAQLRAK